MNFSPVFVFVEKTELLFSSRLKQNDLHVFLEVSQYRRLLLLVAAVEEMKTFRHLMKRMIPEGHELLVVVA